MPDRVETKVKRMTATGSAVANPCYVNAICSMHSSGSTGAMKFYDTAGTPGESDTAKCEVDIVGTGVFPFYIPDPGAMFKFGVYVKLPANVTINLFYKDI